MKTRRFGKTFSERVAELARSIPKGRVRKRRALSQDLVSCFASGAKQKSHKVYSTRRVTTYGDLARACGAGPMASQSITSILSKACDRGVKDIPFHRIVYANGKIWINDKRRAERMKLYKKEGIKIDAKDRVVHFEDIRI